jgi:hypothetical protein
MTAGLGTKTVYVQWRDAAATGPSVRATTSSSRRIRRRPNATTASTTRCSVPGRFGIPVRITWPAATDNVGGSWRQGISGGEDRQRRRSVDVATVPASSGPGHLARPAESRADVPHLRVHLRQRNNTAVPRAARRSDGRVKRVQRRDAFTGTWALSNSAVYVGGKAKVSSKANSTATVSFRGNRVGWMRGWARRTARPGVHRRKFQQDRQHERCTISDRKLVYTKAWAASGATRSGSWCSVPSGHPKVVVRPIFYLQ